MALIFYRVVDRIPRVIPEDQFRYAAVLTGERRPPRKGEWYVSGAIPEAYRMPGEGSTIEHRIARIVKRPGDPEAQRLIVAASYAVVDFRALALELNETDPLKSPALRAAQRLTEALKPFTEGIS